MERVAYLRGTVCSLQLSLMRGIRQSILERRFPEFVQEFMERLHPEGNYEPWAVNALASVGIQLKPSEQNNT